MAFLATINVKRGLLRLWIVATAIWFVLVLAVNSQAIFYWLGYHYTLLRSHDSIGAALHEKEQVHRIVGACRAAVVRACPSRNTQSRPSPPVDYDALIEEIDAWRKQCTGSREFLSAFIDEQRKLGLADASNTLSGAPCAYMADLEIPYVQWPRVVGYVSFPFAPLALYFVVLWVGRGFARHT